MPDGERAFHKQVKIKAVATPPDRPLLRYGQARRVKRIFDRAVSKRRLEGLAESIGYGVAKLGIDPVVLAPSR